MNIYEDLGHEIAKVAYELFEKSGQIHGRDLENWLEAERIVMAKYKDTGFKESACSPATSSESAVKEKKASKAGVKKETPKKTSVKTSAKTTRKKKE